MIEQEKVMRGLYACSEDYGVPDICGRMNCPYKDHPVECVHLLARDAYNLLSKMEPRVLTLEEVKSDHDRIIFMECDESKTWNYVQNHGSDFFHSGIALEWVKFLTVGGSDYLFRLAKDYGKSWRCWSSKPSEQILKETPWGVWRAMIFNDFAETSEKV